MTATTRRIDLSRVRITFSNVLTITWVWPPRPEGHHCHAKHCPLLCPPERLTCPRHWFMAPKPLRDRVWATYRPGQCDDKNPSAAWHEAADACTAAIWKKELAALVIAETALELAWPASTNPLAWESFKAIAGELLGRAAKALGLAVSAAMDQNAKTIVITLAVQAGKARARARS